MNLVMMIYSSIMPQSKDAMHKVLKFDLHSVVVQPAILFMTAARKLRDGFNGMLDEATQDWPLGKWSEVKRKRRAGFRYVPSDTCENPDRLARQGEGALGT